MRGPAKSSVRLTVERGTNKDLKEFTIVREIIHVQSVRAHVESGDIGYIRITQFNQEAYDGVRKAFDHFRTDPGLGEAEGLHPRPAQQSRRPAQSGGRDHQRLRRQRRDRLDPRPQPRSGAALHRPSRRQSGAGQAARRAHQRRLGLGVGDRLGRAAGPQARDPDRHALVRQGLGADDPAARRERRAQADDRALLHAVRPLDPGQGDRSRHQGAREHPRRSQGQGVAASEKPRCPAISRTATRRRRAPTPMCRRIRTRTRNCRPPSSLLHGAKAETLKKSRSARGRHLAMTFGRWLLAVALPAGAWPRRRVWRMREEAIGLRRLQVAARARARGAASRPDKPSLANGGALAYDVATTLELAAARRGRPAEAAGAGAEVGRSPSPATSRSPRRRSRASTRSRSSSQAWIDVLDGGTFLHPKGVHRRDGLRGRAQERQVRPAGPPARPPVQRRRGRPDFGHRLARAITAIPHRGTGRARVSAGNAASR